ncbi:FAD-binding oxidoreductase [Aspergillus clavatus NRRL 1]|uniref:FAD binding domain protein n=1 Tax=Aspergillus clavatus (strain ATCC 1007 / CBS 513.65 / DSM 816 / NCTC 3887 / NRRL 1 / QM 1276 / 107) TaxID=344612 RepID=A1C4M9_ASPCL|nr:FAD binding domain protein [Aspergillus clavatus NRRL 1]EAW15369.1 FAD binding domain protein [Aspergillus clavatus NRRL 1]
MAESITFKNKLRHALPDDIRVVFETDEDYKAMIATWNIRSRHRPLVIVQLGVNHLAIRGGGHSFEGLSLGGSDGALVLDMILMNKIESNPGKNEPIAEGGAILGDISLHAFKNGGKMIPMGTCPSVGIAGQVQCGGFGFHTRTHGLLVDRALAFEVVTADGAIRQVNKKEHADLFYALRGSGSGSFGVITSVTLRTNNAPGATANFSIRWDLDSSDVPDILKAVHHACLKAPPGINPMIIIWLGVLEVYGTILAESDVERDESWRSFSSLLPRARSLRMKPLSFIDSLIEISSLQTSAPWYQDLDQVHREGEEHLRYMKIKAGFIPGALDDSFLHTLGDFLMTQPTTGVRVQLLALNPEIEPDPDTSSVKARHCAWLMGMSVYLQAQEYGQEGLWIEAAERLPWLTKAYELFYPHTVGGYLGDDDLEEGQNGRSMMESFYGHHLPRLSAIKEKYDPQNLFHHPLSIPVLRD